MCVLLTSTGCAQIVVKKTTRQGNIGQIIGRFHQPTEQEIVIVVEQKVTVSGSVPLVLSCCFPAPELLASRPPEFLVGIR